MKWEEIHKGHKDEEEMGSDKESEEGREKKDDRKPKLIRAPQRKSEDLAWALWPSERSGGFKEPWAC